MNILICGKTSYVGRSIGMWLENVIENCNIHYISLRTDEWKQMSLSKFDAVILCSAVVHIQETYIDYNEFDRVNHRLSLEFAQKAKQDCVNKLIFLSSMAVYGLFGDLKRDTIIAEDTPCLPVTKYGRSKLEAENSLLSLSSEAFRVSILRAPMIYGPSCPGNYAALRRLVLRSSIIPLHENRRSMIFIINLAELVRKILSENGQGLYYPQNCEYLGTETIANNIRKQNNKGHINSRFLGIIVRWAGRVGVKQLSKAFGSLVYSHEMSNHFGGTYCIIDTLRSLELTERYWVQGVTKEFIDRCRQVANSQ